MQSLNNIGNKKAVLGGMMTTFIATVVIVAILVIFILLSGSVRSFSNIQSGTRIDKEYPNLQYIVSFDNLVLLKDLMGSSTGSELKTFEIAMDYWAINWGDSSKESKGDPTLFKNKASILGLHDSKTYTCCEFEKDCIGFDCKFVEGFPILRYRHLPYALEMTIQSHLAKELNKK